MNFFFIFCLQVSFLFYSVYSYLCRKIEGYGLHYHNKQRKQTDVLAFLDYAKKLGFKVTKEKTALAKPEVLDGLTAEDRKFIAALSQKTKKAAAKRFYKKISSKSTSL